MRPGVGTGQAHRPGSQRARGGIGQRHRDGTRDPDREPQPHAAQRQRAQRPGLHAHARKLSDQHPRQHPLRRIEAARVQEVEQRPSARHDRRERQRGEARERRPVLARVGPYPLDARHAADLSERVAAEIAVEDRPGLLRDRQAGLQQPVGREPAGSHVMRAQREQRALIEQRERQARERHLQHRAAQRAIEAPAVGRQPRVARVQERRRSRSAGAYARPRRSRPVRR